MDNIKSIEVKKREYGDATEGYLIKFINGTSKTYPFYDENKFVEYKYFLPIILDDSREFVNGFKVVRLSNFLFAYLRESDNKLLPFMYELASDFDEYGFAMVAQKGTVAIIRKSDFAVINDLYDFVSAFSKGEIPLAKVGIRTDNISNFLTTDGLEKKFISINPNISNETMFDYNTKEFDESDYIFSNDKILFSNGFFYDIEYLVEKLGIDALREEGIQKVFKNKNRG